MLAPAKTNISETRSGKRSSRTGTLILFIFLVFIWRGFSAEKSMETECLLQNWAGEDGLPDSRVQAMARTPDGYLWIGTWNGLARFDGVRFVTFNTNNTPALEDNRITCLLTDHEGTLWIGSRNGILSKRQHGVFTTVNLRAKAPHVSWLHGLAEDHQHGLWLATEGEGAIRLENGHLNKYGAKSGLPSSPVWQVTCDTTGNLWAISDTKLWKFAQDRWQQLDGIAPLSQPVRSIAPSQDGGLWVGVLGESPVGNRGGRIIKLKDDRWVDELKPYPWNQDSLRSRIDLVLEDRSGRLWCATDGAGVFCHNPGGDWQPLTQKGDLSIILSGCLGDDQGSSIWLGTKATGLYRVRPRTVTTLTTPGLEQNIFLTACATRDGSLWGGTADNGVFRWNNGKMMHYGTEQGLTNKHVAVLFEDRRTNLWAGTWGGLFRFNGENFEATPGPPVLRKTVLALAEDHKGNLWAGTDDGLVQMHENKSRVFGKADGLDALFIRAVEEDSAGQIWVAVTGRGLFRSVGDQFKHCPIGRPGWGENLMRALYADAEGALWIATEGAGLLRFKNEQLTHYTVRDGLSDDHLLSVLADHAGNLWFGSDNGIFGCPKSMLEKYERGMSPKLNCWRLTQADGLANKVCSGAGQPTVAQTSVGRFWFPNGNSLATFDSNRLPHKMLLSTPVIEEALVDGSLQKPEPDGSLRLLSRTKRLELHFTSPNIDAPEHLSFRVRLKGLDTNWVAINESRLATYGPLEPGQYEFNVAATGDEDRWIETARPLKIKVIPSFYQLRSVQIAAALALLAAVAITAWQIEHARSRRRLNRLEIQRARDNERQRIARDIHDDLGSGLTEIIMVSDHLREDFAQTPASEKRISDISARARALTRAMDEVVWAVNPRNDTLESLITYLDDFAQEHLTLAGIRYRLDAPPELPDLLLSAEMRHSLYLASKEALNNAAKHAGASEVWIRLVVNGSSFTLSIEDNGKGFNPNQQPERGNGLYNMQKRLEEVGGHCEMSRGPGAGMKVKFKVTVRQNPPS